jgi:hypothetical protein
MKVSKCNLETLVCTDLGTLIEGKIIVMNSVTL